MLQTIYQEDIYKFIESYFKEINDISEFHLNFFIENKIPTIDINLLILEKFIFQAFKFLKTNLEFKFSNFLHKLYNDIHNLLQFIEQFNKKSQIEINIFENDFLPLLPKYQLLKEKLEDKYRMLHHTDLNISSLEVQIKFFNPKNKEDTNELKHLRGRLVDAIHYNAKSKEDISKITIALNNLKNDLKDTFIEEFHKSKISYLSKYNLVLNTKLFYFNKKMWEEINQNQKTLSYFNNLGLKNINLKIYIENYLKHIDFSKSKNSNKYSQIENILKAIDE